MTRHDMNRLRRTGAIFATLSLIMYLIACSSSGARSRAHLVVDYTRDADSAMSTITHSGATVAEVVRELRGNPADDGLRALLQPYLAPMSRALAMCPVSGDTNRAWKDLQTDLAARNQDTPASRPAWRDLLDEGRYRVYFDADGVRLFAPGADAGAAFRDSWPLLRFPVRFLRDSGLSRCTTVELFAYTNTYENLALTVVPKAHLIDATSLTTASGLKPLNLNALDDFLRAGTAPQAIEVTDDNKFYLYGRQGETATLASTPLSVADLAVAYRAVFWSGWNEPYISLDKHEDNRYAKVNFGGLLTDTRIGQVVLDADRYFKTLSTGLDPFERRDIADHIRSRVPQFLPADVVELLDQKTGSSEYRYWFYPDSLRVVTDSGIGVVSSPRFLADVERQDGPKSMSVGQRQSIDDLNRRYHMYSQAVPTYAELDHVGSLLALVYWLRETRADQRVDLASLLSVELPAWQTERATDKLMAVNSYCGPVAHLRRDSPGFLPRTRVFDFSKKLSTRSPKDSDDALLDFGAQCFNNLSPSAYMMSADLSSGQRIDALKAELDRDQAALKRLEQEIDSAARSL
ncbi:MAG: hypothetical protein Q8N51_05670, partial [Gammaproteobacteria bacterium]|nr:hypothetical protein [Gammaproteobacteria bacterium]